MKTHKSFLHTFLSACPGSDAKWMALCLIMVFCLTQRNLTAQGNERKPVNNPSRHLPRQLIELEKSVTENLTGNILPFWSENMLDEVNGGFYGHMDAGNRIDKDADRGGIMNARILWTFSAAYRVLKDIEYLKTATHARDYILDHFIDREYGGAFRSVNADGEPVDTRKQLYTQAFFIYALSEYYRATGDRESLAEARNIYETIEKNAFDRKYKGYFEVYGREWERIHEKMFGDESRDTRKAMNTHIHLLEAYANLYRTWPDKKLAGSLRNLIGVFTDKIIDPRNFHLIVYFNEKWEPTSSLISYGHDIETSWLLTEAAHLLEDPALTSKVRKISIKLAQSACEGLQADGSLIYEKDSRTGHLNTRYQWWSQAEAILGFVNAYKLTGDESWLEKAMRCWNYTERNLVDHAHGEWLSHAADPAHGNNRAYKAGFWKGPYHNGRMCLEIIRRVSDHVSFRLNDLEYFEKEGVHVMAFQDMYPEGHQGGISIIMHDMRVATNGDLRLNRVPGQWQPIPKLQKRVVDAGKNMITAHLTYPDSSRNRKGFNPIIYPDLYFNYSVKVRAQGKSVVISVDLDRPVPEAFSGQVSFNLELFPGRLFGKTWHMDGRSGIFPRQPHGPALTDQPSRVTAPQPMATGECLVVAPENDLMRMTIESETGDLQLFDGRYQHNNGWFVVRSPVKENTTSGVVKWVVTPYAVHNWKRSPVIQVSQVGYLPAQKKKAFIELDKREEKTGTAKLIRIGANGERQEVLEKKPEVYGRFLRYKYLEFDFSEVDREGMYLLAYGDHQSHPFKIGKDAYRQNVWQPVLEYFLPVQMCHMQVNEKYRVWHGLCHMDDARMAPANHNHFDGYRQGPSTLTGYEPGEHVPGLNSGGWHDAGDYDLRVESQSGEIYMLTKLWETFHVNYDETTIDQANHLVEIHQPDGKPDVLQQIEHGALAVINGYKNHGRLYRGIICPFKRQYVMLGDGANMTDGVPYEEGLPPDDRWVFTEDNPRRELTVAAHLAAASRALRGFNDTLSDQCLRTAEEIFSTSPSVSGRTTGAKIHAAIELFRTTNKNVYKQYLLDHETAIIRDIDHLGWLVGTVLPAVGNPSFTASVRKAVKKLCAEVAEETSSTPYGIPYQPRIWGPGWTIQRFGVQQYFLHAAFPDIFPDTYMFNALNFILGVHPGSNTSSFVSGVGARSPTVAYGFNRADWSYIPGGVVSGTGLIRPDLPELLDFPYLWQQQEYCMGGHAANFMFLVLAADRMASDTMAAGRQAYE